LSLSEVVGRLSQVRRISHSAYLLFQSGEAETNGAPIRTGDFAVYKDLHPVFDLKINE